MPTSFEKEKHVLIRMDSDEDWESFFECCDGYLLRHDYERLSQYLKDDVKTVVLEKDYYDADFRDTYYGFFSRKFAHYPSTTIRASFFSERISPRMLYKLDDYQRSFIGFSVIRPNRVASIGRTLLDPRKLQNMGGYVCMAEYPIHILGAELLASGFPYMSQDTDVTVCAHSACWMIFRYFSQRYTRYAEIWPYEVSQLTEDVSHGRLVPSKGLTVWQITEMFSKFGFYPEIYMRADPRQNAIFDRLLYTYVESGLPVVAGLRAHQHAITIIGHISDFSDVRPGTTSDHCLKGFIANDDNHMPYHGIRKDDPKPTGHWSDFKISEIDCFIVPLYEKIHLSAEHVIKLVEEILAHNQLGVNSRSNVLTKDRVVTRTFLTSSKSYKKVTRVCPLPFGISKVYAELKMPKFIWVCEISTAELYARGEVAGELIFDATANQFDRFSFLVIHYPGFLLLNNRDYLTDDPERFKVYRIDTEGIHSYSCYVNNLCEV